MQQIRIGIISLTPAWSIFFQQEGIPFEKFSFDETLNLSDYSVLIINRKLDIKETKIVGKFVKSGGCLLKFAKDLDHQKEKKKYLQPDKDSIYSDLGIIDIFDKVYIPKIGIPFDKSLQIYSEKFGNGCSLILPFDLDFLQSDSTKKRKRFFAERDELPSEIVAKISKYKIREIIRTSLEYLHHFRNLPFIQKCYTPAGNNSIFIFRVDTDFCSLENGKQLYEICKKNKIRSSWFIDTNSEENLKQLYSKMNDAEIGFHCARHKVFPDYERNYQNINTGLSHLETFGINPKGFAAPYGDWNLSLAKAISDHNFEYSSEFTLDYDNLPFFPIMQDQLSEVLQIPIHPISMGRLNRSHFSKDEMIEYYKMIINMKLMNQQPIILYHHPQQKRFDLWNSIFSYINEQNIPKMTMAEYANWWKKRVEINVKCILSNGLLRIENSDIPIKVTNKENFAFITSKETRISDIKWKQKRYFQYKNLSNLRKQSWRELLYNYESKRARKGL